MNLLYGERKPVLRPRKYERPVLFVSSRQTTLRPSSNQAIPLITDFYTPPEQIMPLASMPAQATPQREAQQTAPQPLSGNKINIFRRHLNSRRVILGMAIILFTLGSTAILSQVLHSKPLFTPAYASSTNSSVSGPDESKPSSETVKNYAVASDLPRVLTIPKIGVESRILRMGVDANNNLEAPKNVYDTGWYTGSSKPTDTNGAMLLDGHVSGITKSGGVFHSLGSLVRGDTMQLEQGNGTIYTYKVIKTEQVKVSSVNISNLLSSVNPKRPGLNLITCSGKYDSANKTYRDRTIVYTERL